MKIIKKFIKLKLYILLYWNMMFQKNEESVSYIYEDEEDYIDEEDSSSR